MCVLYKLEVVEFSEKSGNRSAEGEYRVSEKLHRVRDWRKKKRQLPKLPGPAKTHKSLLMLLIFFRVELTGCTQVIIEAIQDG